MSESKFYHFTSSGLFYGMKSSEEAVTALREGGFIWMNYYKPEIEELHSLVDTMEIHPLSVEDCLDSSQVPKIEHFPGNTFIIFNAYTYKDKTLYIDEIDFFIGKNFLITVSGINSDDRRPLNNAIKIIENDPSVAKSGPAFLMHVVLDYVVDQKFHAFEALEDELEIAEDLVIDSPDQFQVSELLRLRKDLLNLRKSLFHEREILVKICRMDCPFITDKAIFAFRDIYDHLAKFFELSESYREIVTSLMELYTSLLNNLMTKVSNETNTSVRRLTLITTIFMPLTLIASIGGMSEYTMMTGGEPNWKTAYLLLAAGLGLIAIINFFLLRRLERGKKRLN
ncbi:MAG TPA: magnesium transporter CorA family protein [Bacteroidales bacterium]|nr:magnesium transporter CorA family protein [Bacteroidales bacterium]HOX74248.1 magnesium transporter CorA family protein [Bacteroidales bacterium]HQM69373.1 magnesium transporter CorA family protein [Bacteroidales bacterium]